MKIRRSSLLVGVLLAGSFAAAFGQATNAGDISGTVTDTTGAVISDATVTVVNIATGVARDYTTNAAGIYDTNSIVAGDYKITFSRAGFTTLVHSSITVNVGQLQLNAQLAVGTVSTQVVVNTDVPLVNTENGAVTTTGVSDWAELVQLQYPATGTGGSSRRQPRVNGYRNFERHHALGKRQPAL
jgi:hypothetical protein